MIIKNIQPLTFVTLIVTITYLKLNCIATKGAWNLLITDKTKSSLHIYYIPIKINNGKNKTKISFVVILASNFSTTKYKGIIDMSTCYIKHC